MNNLKVLFFGLLSFLMVVCITLNVIKIIAGTAVAMTGIGLVICVIALICDLLTIYFELKK